MLKSTKRRFEVIEERLDIIGRTISGLCLKNDIADLKIEQFDRMFNLFSKELSAIKNYLGIRIEEKEVLDESAKKKVLVAVKIKKWTNQLTNPGR